MLKQSVIGNNDVMWHTKYISHTVLLLQVVLFW